MDAPLRIAYPSPCSGAGVTNEGMAPIGVVPESDPTHRWPRSTTRDARTCDLRLRKRRSIQLSYGGLLHKWTSRRTESASVKDLEIAGIRRSYLNRSRLMRGVSSADRTYTSIAYESALSYGASSGPRLTASSEAVALLGGQEVTPEEQAELRVPPEAEDPLPDRPHTQHLADALHERLNHAVSESGPPGGSVPEVGLPSPNSAGTEGQ